LGLDKDFMHGNIGPAEHISCVDLI